MTETSPISYDGVDPETAEAVEAGLEATQAELGCIPPEIIDLAVATLDNARSLDE